ncbi:TPA: EAL domain-containing protein [Vibrio parahaemolyticus]|uniref:EAL domain-containing protein n=1 Tax=Vibrio parahaemolyticus TaxID=670 RepID=UPI003891A086
MNLIPAFQTITSNGSNTVGAEVLSRWHHQGQVYGPADHKTPINWGLVDLEIMKSLIHLVPVIERLYPSIFINVSPQTLSFSDIRMKWFKLLKELTDKAPFQVVIEITEKVTPEQLDNAWPLLSQFNVAFAMDDFGEDHSSVSRLTSYSWQFCKVEIGQLKGLAGNAAVQYCRLNNITPIAERVESVAQSEVAKLLGLEWQQGFLHGKPITFDLEVNSLVKQVQVSEPVRVGVMS